MCQFIGDELQSGYNTSLRERRASWNNKEISNIVEEKTEEEDPELDSGMLRQPETRAISHDQLVIEVKGIYAGLVMVEAKCIDVDEKQCILAQENTSESKPLETHQWQALIALHKQLLHEHHDFFLASQHPSASLSLRKLAAKYSMPARMWRHGIHVFLEMLRHRLPESLEHMLAFIYIAYSMMALLFETVSTFEDTWVECLGDLGRYRMAIEHDDAKDRQIRSSVARSWYGKAAKKSPTIGRLYHHLAIIARPYTLEQLSSYVRCLTSTTPFENARGSITTFFNPIPDCLETIYPECSSVELHEPIDELIRINGLKSKRNGLFLALSNAAALFEFGAPTSRGNLSASRVWPELLTQEIDQSKLIISRAFGVAASTFRVALSKIYYHHYNLLMVHAMPVFIGKIFPITDVRHPLDKAISWTLRCYYLPYLVQHESFLAHNCTSPPGENESNRSLREDYLSRGQVYTRSMFPDNCFSDVMVDDEERMLEQSAHDTYRTVRLLWFASRIPSAGGWIRYDEATQLYLTTNQDVSYQRNRTTVWAGFRKFYVNAATWSIRHTGVLTQTSAVELHYWSILKSWYCYLAQSLLFVQSLSGRMILLASCFHCIAALPTPLNTSSTATEDGGPASGSLLADIASVSLVLLVPGIAELLVRLKRMSAIPVYGTVMSTMAFGWWCSRNDATTSHVLLWSIFSIWGVSSVRFWEFAFQKPTAPSYTLLVVVFMAMVLDIVMVHFMTAAGAPMLQADVLNLSLPSASLALGTTATVLAAHRQHNSERPTAHSVEGPIEEQFETGIESRLDRSSDDRFGRSSDDISETSTDPRWPERRHLLLEYS